MHVCFPRGPGSSKLNTDSLGIQVYVLACIDTALKSVKLMSPSPQMNTGEEVCPHRQLHAGTTAAGETPFVLFHIRPAGFEHGDTGQPSKLKLQPAANPQAAPSSPYS